MLKRVAASELRRVLNSLGKKYLKQNLRGAATRLSELVKTKANTILGNRTRDQIIQFLEMYVLERKSSFVENMYFDYRTETDENDENETDFDHLPSE